MTFLFNELMPRHQQAQKRGKKGCLLKVLIALTILLVCVACLALLVNEINKVVRQNFLKMLGLTSEAEYSTLTKAINRDFNEEQFYTALPSESDGVSATNVLNNSLKLIDGQDLFIAQEFNIDALVKENNIDLKQNFSLNEKEFCFLSNLFLDGALNNEDILKSLDLEDAKGLIDLSVKTIAITKFNVNITNFYLVVRVDTSEFKKQFKELDSIIPMKLVFRINFQIDSQMNVTNEQLKINDMTDKEDAILRKTIKALLQDEKFIDKQLTKFIVTCFKGLEENLHSKIKFFEHGINFIKGD